MRRFLLALGLLFCASSARAADIYFAQAATGLNNGSSCANARALSSHVITDDVAGNVLHLCGVITGAQGSTAFSTLASGAITLKFETGAVLNSPAWGGSTAGAINISHNSWTVDGGTNGTIQNTLDGSVGNTSCIGGTCTVQQAITYGVFSTGNNVTIKNLTISHMCMHTYNLADNGFFRGNCVGIQFSGDNTLVTQNSIDNTASGVVYANTNNGEVSFNNISLTSRFTNISLSGGFVGTGPYLIHNNHLFDPWIWDSSDNQYHHNGLHVFNNGAGSGAANIHFYYNLLDGIWGKGATTVDSHVTSGVFVNDAAVTNKISAVYVTRNVFAFSQAFVGSYPTNTFINFGDCTVASGCTPPNNSISANNTMVGVSGPGCMWVQDSSGSTKLFNNLCATSSGENLVVPGPPFSYISANIDYQLYPGVPTSNAFSVYTPNGNVNSWSAWSSSPYFMDIHCNPSSTPPGTGANCNPTLASANLGSTFRLGAGSTAINAAKNLTSMCGTIPELCTGAPSTFGRGGLSNGVAASAASNWDTGAYPFSGSVVTPPNPPSGLTAAGSGASTINLSWTLPTGTFTGESVYRGTVHNGPYTLVRTGLTGTTFSDTGLAAGTYFYVLTAFNGGILTSITGTGTTATVTCNANCSFPTGSSAIIASNSVAGFNGTFTVLSQPTASTFTYSNSTVGTGTGGSAWISGAESARSSEASATVPVVATISIAPSALTFSSFTVGTPSPTQTVTVTNNSSAGTTVTFSSVTFTGTNPGDFSRTTGCTTLTTPGQTCPTVVTFTPTAPGARNALLTFVDNATGNPQTVPVSGTGVSAAPGVSLNPTSLNFGDQTLSTTSTTRSIILTNTGSGTLTISSVVASGDFAVVTVPVTNCGGTLASLATCSLNVTFTPTATGGRTGAVTVTDNAADNPHVATLSGNGITTKCQMTGNVTLSGNGTVCQ